MPHLKVKARPLAAKSVLRHKAAWAEKFHGILQKHRVKTAAGKFRKARACKTEQRAGAKALLKAVDQQLQVSRLPLKFGMRMGFVIAQFFP